MSGVHEQKASGSVGVFDLPFLSAPLPEKSRLLVPRHPADGNGCAKSGAVSEKGGTGKNRGQHLLRDVKKRQKLFVPAEGMNVVKHRSGGVRPVGGVNLSTGQLPDQIAVYRAEKQFSLLCPAPGSLHMIQNPLQLGRRKVSVGQKSGFFPNQSGKPLLLQLLAVACRPAALPDNGRKYRLAAFLFPHHGRLPLTGNADGGYLLRENA